MNKQQLIEILSQISENYDPEIVAEWLTDVFKTELDAGAVIPEGKFSGTTLLWWAIQVSSVNQEPLNMIRQEINSNSPVTATAQQYTQVTLPIISHYEIGSIKLTRKESSILYFTLRGYTARQIGEVFSRSTRTIEKHISHIHKKLSVNSKSDLIRLANQLGLYNFVIQEAIEAE